MLVKNFSQTCVDYTDFAIWEIENMDAFFKGNGVFEEIFKNEYKMSVSEFPARRSEIEQSNIEIVNHIIDQIGDKHFFLFTPMDQYHLELILMQDQKIMDFGMDIKEVKDDHMYMIIMDKKQQ